MNIKNIKELLDKLNSGDFSEEEEAAMKAWLHNYNMEGETGLSEEDFAEAKANMIEAIDAVRFRGSKKITLWPRNLFRVNTDANRPAWLGKVAAAAAILLVLGAGLYFYNTRHLEGNEATRDLLNYANHDIAPGRSGATLTLANGKVIALSDKQTGVIVGNEKLAYNDGTEINDPAINARHPELVSGSPHSLLTATTAKGQTYQITLSDGTKAWLNADSKLEFFSNFRNTVQRIVKLEGEAYFEVAKNKRQPFIVETEGQTLKVLGTHFNVNAYPDEAGVKTTLLEGSVQVAGRSAINGRLNTKYSVPNTILRPNQQSLLTSNNITVKQVDVNDAIDWKNGDFIFKEETIETIMHKVARWYNIEVNYQGRVNERFTGTVSRNKNISQVLQMLEQTKGVHFKIEGRKVTVTP